MSSSGKPGPATHWWLFCRGCSCPRSCERTILSCTIGAPCRLLLKGRAGLWEAGMCGWKSPVYWRAAESLCVVRERWQVSLCACSACQQPAGLTWCGEKSSHGAGTCWVLKNNHLPLLSFHCSSPSPRTLGQILPWIKVKSVFSEEVEGR